MKDRSDDPSHHERTLLPRSYISLPSKQECNHKRYVLYFNENILINRCALSSDPIQSSFVWYTKVVKYKVFPKCLTKNSMLETVKNCLMLRSINTDGFRPCIKQLHIFVILRHV